MPSARSACQTRPRSRVLLLEDHAGLRDVLLELLQDEEVDVTLCTSLAELRVAVVAYPGAVVVTDSWSDTENNVLSAEQGADLIALGESAPVIVTTGRAWATTSDAGELGNVIVLPKPYDLDQLVQLVRSATTPDASAGGSSTTGAAARPARTNR